MTDETDEWTVIVKDSNGTLLSEGDAVVLIKDLKVKGRTRRSSAALLTKTFA